jgi:cytochrome c-type biogenesis protein CcmE
MPAKVLVPLLLIVGSVCWVAFTSLESANYFYTVDELQALGPEVKDRNLRIKGNVVPGSIRAKQKPVLFTIEENEATLEVAYVSEEPLPDLFQDRAEAVVEGRLRDDGVFEAVHLQAKCASKYEADGLPQDVVDDLPPTSTTNQAAKTTSGY